VTLVRVVELQDFDIRQLLVKEVSSGRVHEVRHMNYTRWPDHVVPESATPLLQVYQSIIKYIFTCNSFCSKLKSKEQNGRL